MIEQVLFKRFTYDRGQDFQGELRIFDSSVDAKEVSFVGYDNHILRFEFEESANIIAEIVDVMMAYKHRPAYIYVVRSGNKHMILVSPTFILAIKVDEEKLDIKD